MKIVKPQNTLRLRKFVRVYLDTQLSKIALKKHRYCSQSKLIAFLKYQAHRARFSMGFKIWVLGANGEKFGCFFKDSNGTVVVHHVCNMLCKFTALTVCLLGMGVDSMKAGLGSKLMVCGDSILPSEAID